MNPWYFSYRLTQRNLHKPLQSMLSKWVKIWFVTFDLEQEVEFKIHQLYMQVDAYWFTNVVFPLPALYLPLFGSNFLGCAKSFQWPPMVMWLGRQLEHQWKPFFVVQNGQMASVVVTYYICFPWAGIHVTFNLLVQSHDWP